MYYKTAFSAVLTICITFFFFHLPAASYHLQPNEQDNIPPPAAWISASSYHGEAPFSISFKAHIQGDINAIDGYHWNFGDGSVSTHANPEHTFMLPGIYFVKLIIWNQQGISATSYRTIFVDNASLPVIRVEAHRLLTTDQGHPTAVLIGSARSQSGAKIIRLVWDNISTGDAGNIELFPGVDLTWVSPAINMKPGRNEVLVTATDENNKVATEKVVLQYPVDQPVISNVAISESQIKQYEKLTIRFDLQTVADNLFFRYDPSPPSGISPGVGVSATGIFQTPSGQVLEQPAFYHQSAQAIECGQFTCYQKTAESKWELRFSPQEPGEYVVKIRVEDASGTVSVTAGRFIVLPSDRKGFIRVSAADPRYFEFSNGELYWPIGPAHGSDYGSYKGTWQNFSRPWMAGKGAYSTNFARWVSSAKEMGNEAFDSNLTFTESYPGHELSQVLSYPDASRFWIGWSSGEIFRPLFKPGTEYQIHLRLKVINLSGPVVSAYPHGLMIKTHGWPSETFEADMRQVPSMIPPISYNAGWHTVVSRYTATDRDSDTHSSVYLSLYLDNISSGDVFIDYFSIRELLPGGALGPEIMLNTSADLHTYVEPGPAAFFDWEITQGEKNGVFFNYVVHDKRDWIQNHLNQYGLFVDSGDGYYQSQNTKARWLLEQWWRYIIARWGYSTAVHSWELNNEGPPYDHSHFRMAQDFARFMQENDAHPHLATTSFWSEWVPEFWTDHKSFPDIGYANIHEYIRDPLKAYDVTNWMIERSMDVYRSQPGIPVMMGEIGIDAPGNRIFAFLSEPNPGIWYHNLLWSQLSSRPIYAPNYWWSQHLEQIDRRSISRAFGLFISDLDLNRGGYVDIDASISNAGLRVLGQRNLNNDRAHLWVQNSLHTWRNVMQVDNPQQVTSQNGMITLKMNPKTRYRIEWWNTTGGTVVRTDELQSDSAGNLTFEINHLVSDLAIKIYPHRRQH